MRRNKRGNNRKNKVLEMARFDKKFVKYLSFCVLVLLAILLSVAIFYHVNDTIKHKHFLADVNSSLEQEARSPRFFGRNLC